MALLHLVQVGELRQHRAQQAEPVREVEALHGPRGEHEAAQLREHALARRLGHARGRRGGEPLGLRHPA